MTDTLAEYNRKRNFEKTPEPKGSVESKGAAAPARAPESGLSFVVQHHLARRDHYDLRLEWDGVLKSWAVPKGPSYNPRDKRLAVQVEDHPLEYGSFEGTIPQGEYGGGVVMLWDGGVWEPQSDAAEGLQSGMLKFVLKGRRLYGKWALVRLKGKAGESRDNWLLLKEKDEYARGDDGVSGFVTSVWTGRTMEEIEAGDDEKFVKNPFDKADVQLCKPVKTVPEGADWLYELKYDGYRILGYIEGNTVRLVTRNGSDYTRRFHDVAAALARWAGDRAMVLDGEVAVTDDKGKTDFQALQGYMKNPTNQRLVYIIFDLLALDGADLRGRPLIDRKKTLEALMKDAPPILSYSPHVAGNGRACFQAACEAGLEGIVGKKAGSLYTGTRNGDWVKLKCDTRQEFVIGGYALSDKKAGGVSSLLLGYYDKGALVYAGRAGTGLSERAARALEEKFRNITRASAPFTNPPKAKSNETLTWLEPVLAAEIKFAEWTGEGLLRQASFKGLREDKNPGEITREAADKPQYDTPEEAPPRGEAGGIGMTKTENSVTIGGIRVTNPDKVLFEDPVITKADVVRYYASAAPRMLPYAGFRILSIVRCPKGISQTCFYKKHPGPGGVGIVTIPVPGSGGETEEYFYIDSAAGFLYEAQMGTLEFHTWGSRVDNLEKPDLMVFDLDPDEGMASERVRQGVKDLKSILDQLSLVSFLKTSGGKGYHVVVPFQPAASWDAFYDFARRVAQVMEQQWPDRYTSNVRKDKRKNKIFIDWIRNGRGATSIAPYAIRARRGARVSAPITWAELDTVAPDGITISQALERLGGSDPWEGFFQVDQRLK